MPAVSAMGTKLKKGSTAIADLTSIGGLELSADTIETTTLDSDGWRTFAQGLKDAGEVSISGYFDPTSQAGLYDDFQSGVVGTYTIEFPAALRATWEFQAIVIAYNTGAEMEDNVSFEGTLKVSGKPTLTIGPTV